MHCRAIRQTQQVHPTGQGLVRASEGEASALQVCEFGQDRAGAARRVMGLRLTLRAPYHMAFMAYVHGSTAGVVNVPLFEYRPPAPRDGVSKNQSKNANSCML